VNGNTQNFLHNESQ